MNAEPSSKINNEDNSILGNVCKMVDNDGSFRQRAVIKFLVKRRKSAAEIHTQTSAYIRRCAWTPAMLRDRRNISKMGTRPSKMSLVPVLSMILWFTISLHEVQTAKNIHGFCDLVQIQELCNIDTLKINQAALFEEAKKTSQCLMDKSRDYEGHNVVRDVGDQCLKYTDEKR
ncbi:hypothetical protein ANN_24331 [Periplaneta americana]|uniref:Uncharacterized protein n=1 Tax=Periplaneta americana TaxID=6978 RepID=A0ABQ8S346_PERAM|nr:hypothetical protein ANN_24331 [Periplaneta americana]